jgi:type I restriction enzyme S subunit
MTKDWKQSELGEVANIQLSGVDKHIVPGEASVRLCNYLDVYQNRRLTRAHEFAYGTASPTEIARLHLKKGDVLITKDSETPDDIGIPCVVVDDLENTICGYHLALIRPRNGVNPIFLSYRLQNEAAKRHFLRTANGVTRFGLGLRAIASLPLSLPAPDEQAAIARVLDAVETAIERTRKAIAEAKTVKRAILQKFFYAALGKTAYANRPTKKLPIGWELILTEKLLAEDPKNGVSPRSSSEPPGIPTFSIAAVRDGRVDLDNPEHLKYALLPDQVAKRVRLTRGDLLIVRGNANPALVGKAGVVGRVPEGCIYPDITKRVVFRRDGVRNVSPEFAVLAWNHPIVHNQVLRRAKTSNGTLKINNRDVKQIVLPVPPNEVQANIVQLAAAVNLKIDALDKVLEIRKQLKRALMHDLLTGRVRVNPCKLAQAILA